MISSNVRSGCWATRANICSACFSNGETLPPRGFDAQLPLSIQRCSHRTAELGSISKFSAASRREAPDFTASITRLRKSAESDFATAHPKKENQCRRIAHLYPLGNPADSNWPGNPLAQFIPVVHQTVGKEDVSRAPEHAHDDTKRTDHTHESIARDREF